VDQNARGPEKPDSSESAVRQSTAVKGEIPAGDPALVAKLAEVFSADYHLHASVFSLREWFKKRKPGEDFGLRLLDCQLWATSLEWLLVQAQIIAKGEEK